MRKKRNKECLGIKYVAKTIKKKRGMSKKERIKWCTIKKKKKKVNRLLMGNVLMLLLRVYIYLFVYGGHAHFCFVVLTTC